MRTKLNASTLSALCAIALASVSCAKRKFNAADSGQNSSPKTETAPAVGGLDVNDVSVLFPLANGRRVTPGFTGFDKRSSAELRDGLLSLEAKSDAGKDLLPEDLFLSLMSFVTSKDPGQQLLLFKDGAPTFVKATVPPTGIKGLPFLESRAHWRLVAFRFDPCAPGEHASIKCGPQFRLVFQPITITDDLWNDDDSGLHLVYGLTEDQAGDVARSLAAIKSPETTGVPLGMHPVIFKEGLTGPTSKAFRKLVLEVAQLERLRAVATSVFVPSKRALDLAKDDDFGQMWFFRGALVKDGKIIPMAQQVGSSISADQVFHFPSPSPATRPAAPKGSVSSVSADDIGWFPREARWFDVNSGKARTTAPAPSFDHIAAVDNPHIGMLVIENQSLDNGVAGPTHVDCVSCHRTTNHFYRNAVDTPFGRGYIAAKTQYPGQPGITPVADRDLLQGNESPQLQGWQSRNFSYFSAAPTIALRTLNETIAAAHIVNQKYLKVANPWTKSCDQRAVMTCYYIDKKDWSACAAICQAAPAK